MSVPLVVFGTDIDVPVLEVEILDGLGIEVVVTVEPADGRGMEPPPFDVDVAALRQIIIDHESAERRQLRQVVEKARAVWRGEDTFTQAQAQKILAGLVLVIARYLR